MKLPQFIAHRGASQVAPENTLAAFKAAKQLGATWVECDVALTADYVPVIFHDDELSRTSNSHGKLTDFSFDELIKLDAGSWFEQKFSGEKIPSLYEVLTVCQQLQLGINIEIKPQFFQCQQKFSRILEVIKPFWEAGYKDLLISSFSIRPLAFFLEQAPDIPRALLMQYVRPDWRYHATRLACVSVNIKASIATPDLVQAIKQLELQVLCYTVNDQHEVNTLMKLGVDGFFSDQLFK